MITHDTLTMRIQEKSAYETRFKNMFSGLQEDPALLQSFLDEPSTQLIAAGIPVAGSLADSVFDAPFMQPVPVGGESLMEMKFHWWGVELIASAGLMRFIRLSMEMGTGMAQIKHLCNQLNAPDSGLTNQIIDDLKGILHQQHAEEDREDQRKTSIHWRVSWSFWATGLPIDILLHFSSRKFSEE